MNKKIVFSITNNLLLKDPNRLVEFLQAQGIVGDSFKEDKSPYDETKSIQFIFTEILKEKDLTTSLQNKVAKSCTKHHIEDEVVINYCYKLTVQEDNIAYLTLENEFSIWKSNNVDFISNIFVDTSESYLVSKFYKIFNRLNNLGFLPVSY